MRHLVSTVALAPILLLQGHRVRQSALRLPEPEGLRSGSAGNGPLLRLLIVGDSAAAGVGVQTQAEALSGSLVGALQSSFCVHWKLLARTGATTADCLRDLSDAAAENYDVVVSSLGVNDVTSRHTLKQWRQQQNELIKLLENRFRASHIFLSGLPPMHRFPLLPQPLRWYVGGRARQFDQALERLAVHRPSCEFVPLNFIALDTATMAIDGFHPGPAVYRSWADELVRRIHGRLQDASTSA